MGDIQEQRSTECFLGGGFGLVYFIRNVQRRDDRLGRTNEANVRVLPYPSLNVNTSNLGPVLFKLGHDDDEDAILHLGRDVVSIDKVAVTAVARGGPGRGEDDVALEEADAALARGQSGEEGLVARTVDDAGDAEAGRVWVPGDTEVLLAGAGQGDVDDVGRLGVEDVDRGGEGGGVAAVVSARGEGVGGVTPGLITEVANQGAHEAVDHAGQSGPVRRRAEGERVLLPLLLAVKVTGPMPAAAARSPGRAIGIVLSGGDLGRVRNGLAVVDGAIRAFGLSVVGRGRVGGPVRDGPVLAGWWTGSPAGMAGTPVRIAGTGAVRRATARTPPQVGAPRVSGRVVRPRTGIMEVVVVDAVAGRGVEEIHRVLVLVVVRVHDVKRGAEGEKMNV